MSIRSKAILWASIILAAALVAGAQGLSDAAASGIIMGLSGAALGSIYSDRAALHPCKGECA